MTGKLVAYVLCRAVAGTAHVTAAREVDAVEWVPIGDLREYVPDGFFGPVQDHLDYVLAKQLRRDQGSD